MSRDKTSFILTFTIDEGKRYTINDIQIKSTVPDIDANQWYKYVTFKTGNWYKDVYKRQVYVIFAIQGLSSASLSAEGIFTAA